jgi:uncharacterized repeat protein (TIGR03803 family)
MQLTKTNNREDRLTISNVEPKFGSIKLAAAALRCGVTITVLAALLLIIARPAQAQTETVLYNFCSQPGCTDGGAPQAGLISDGAGNLYGTTGQVGSSDGVVFELSPNGSGGWNYSTLYSFCSEPNCADGRWPYSHVILDGSGNLYGITYYGGAYGGGVVFELSPGGGGWTETVLHSFGNGNDGYYPASGLIMDGSGNLYGTTLVGGPSGYGIVYELSPSEGVWTEQVLYSPGSTSGYGINEGLAMDAAGHIFGATFTTAFELSPNGQGGWNPTVIHTFAGGPKDGADPGTPVLDKAGNVYGTTGYGGTKNYGTVWKLTPVTKGKKKGTWTEKILYSFKGKKDGIGPYSNDGALVFDEAGNIYGTTQGGGGHNDGTVFELAVSGTSYKEKVLWSFNGTDGTQPRCSLILDTGNLYGTTDEGGSNGDGVVFEVTP